MELFLSVALVWVVVTLERTRSRVNELAAKVDRLEQGPATPES